MNGHTMRHNLFYQHRKSSRICGLPLRQCRNPHRGKTSGISQFPAVGPSVYTHPQMKRAASCRLCRFLAPLYRHASPSPSCLLARIPPRSAAAQATHPGNTDLTIYAIDVEGGQATLMVSPSGDSMLVDTGWGDNNGRDAERIQAGDERRRHHQDRQGAHHSLPYRPRGRRSESRRARQGRRVSRSRRQSRRLRHHAPGLRSLRQSHRQHAAPHSCIPATPSTFPDSTSSFLPQTANTSKAVPGVKPTPNSYCASEPKWDLDTTENPRSAGILVRFGRFRFLDLGDLTKAKEIPLVCPDNLIGHIDLYLVEPSRHESLQLARVCRCHPSARRHHGQRRAQGRQPRSVADRA